jgi:hypothetical protein
MLDGALIEGTVRYPLPPSRARLYDYLNLGHESFAKLYMDDGTVCLVNKTYIVSASHCDDEPEAALPQLTDLVEMDETYA